MLIKVDAPLGKRSDIIELVSVFRGRIVDVSADMLMIEISGQEGKLSRLSSSCGLSGSSSWSAPAGSPWSAGRTTPAAIPEARDRRTAVSHSVNSPVSLSPVVPPAMLAGEAQ